MVATAAELDSPEDLAAQYYNIFKSGNRNAASHKWASYILDRASDMSAATVKNVFKGFCPVSGSPIPDSPRTLYKVSLPTISGDTMTGVTHHCCWPCICDESDFLRIDTKTVQTADGPQKMHFLVMGDPCVHPEKLSEKYTDPFSGAQSSLGNDAPELSCDGQKLSGATFSDGGYPIYGFFFTDETDLVPAPAGGFPSDDPTFGYGDACLKRREAGYDSGMGLIFHLVAKINPIPNSPALPLPGEQSDLQQKSEVFPDSIEPPKTAKQDGMSTIVWMFLVVLSVASVAVFVLRVCGRDSGAAKRQSSPPCNNKDTAALELPQSNFSVLE